jgi:predicted Na+-dependent transporter
LRRPRASPLAINAAAIGAILLRHIRLRAGQYYTGFLMTLLMPLAHLLIIVIVFHLFGRLAPQGTESAGSVVVFIIVVCLLAVYSTDFSPRHWPGMVFAVAATITELR